MNYGKTLVVNFGHNFAIKEDDNLSKCSILMLTYAAIAQIWKLSHVLIKAQM